MQIEREEGREVVLTLQHALPVKSSTANISIGNTHVKAVLYAIGYEGTSGKM